MSSVSNKIIDLRSDTVTRPSCAMRDFLSRADVGDDVYGDDPSVHELEDYVADLLGKESSLFVSSGTQGNLLSLLSHCERGMEAIAVDTSHIAHYEAGGSAVLGGICTRVLPPDSSLFLSEAQLRSAIRPDDFHYPISRLLCLENTFHGRIQPLDHFAHLSSLARDLGLSVHLDGARLMNVSVAMGISPRELCSSMDSISLCLSKGLGAPMGSVLSGDSSFISRARRFRKMLGGGLRQWGLMASAGMYALRHNVDRLAEDHENARALARRLSSIEGIDIDMSAIETNMVWLSFPHDTDIVSYMSDLGILLKSGNPMRLICHLDYSGDDCDRVIDAFASYLSV